jgi:hypothetical protein
MPHQRLTTFARSLPRARLRRTENRWPANIDTVSVIAAMIKKVDSSYRLPSEAPSPLRWETTGAPAGGTTVLLLTVGAVPALGRFTSDAGHVAWCCVPSRTSSLWKRPNEQNEHPQGQRMLLLTCGGTPAFGTWKNNEGFDAWCDLPEFSPRRESAA